MSVPETCPRMPEGVQVEQQGKRYLLLHPQVPRWAMVNATGLAVARLCDGQHTPAQMAAAVAGRWGLEPSVILPDVQACLASLEQAGFLSGAPPSAHPGDRDSWRLHLNLTERCNLQCRHCGVADGPPPPDRLSSEAIRGLIDQAIEGGAEGIAFSGGEPLLRDDCLELLRHAVRCGSAHPSREVKILLATNATLVDEAVARALAELGVIVQVSLDGATAEVHDAIRGPGAFDSAWRGIEHLQRAGMGERLALNVTLMQANIHQVADIATLVEARRVPGLRFFSLACIGRAADAWSELDPCPEAYSEAYNILYKELAGKTVTVDKSLPGLVLEPPAAGMWCRLGHILAVDSQGDIYPCNLLTEPQFRLGNVADTPLVEALASEKLGALIGLCQGRKDEIEACRACNWRHFCQANCPASIYLSQGTWYATDELCDLRRELYRDLIFEGALAAGSES